MAGVQKKSEFGHGYAAALEDVTSRLKYENRVTAAPQPEPGAGEDDAAWLWGCFAEAGLTSSDHSWLQIGRSAFIAAMSAWLARRGARAPVEGAEPVARAERERLYAMLFERMLTLPIEQKRAWLEPAAAVRRGRFLTEAEKLQNLSDGLGDNPQPPIDNRFVAPGCEQFAIPVPPAEVPAGGVNYPEKAGDMGDGVSLNAVDEAVATYVRLTADISNTLHHKMRRVLKDFAARPRDDRGAVEAAVRAENEACAKLCDAAAAEAKAVRLNAEPDERAYHLWTEQSHEQDARAIRSRATPAGRAEKAG